MKTPLMLACFAFVCAVAQASEFVTLNRNKVSIAVQPTDVVQVVGVIQNDGPSTCNFIFSDGGQTSSLLIPGTSPSGGIPTPFNNIVLTGLSEVRIPTSPTSQLAVTLRITKTADEIASTPVVLPPVADGVYAVSIETSTDMENWAPAAPGDYLGDTSHRFFRIKALRKPAPNP